MKTQIITNVKISSKMRNRISHEIRKLFGRNIYTLHKLQVQEINNCYVYTEQDVSTIPKESIQYFIEILKKGKYYVFGVLQIKKTGQKIYFLADLNNVMYVNNEEIIFYPTKEETIIIHVK